MSTVDWYAKTYTERYGFSLVMIEPNQKHTTRQGWGDNTIDTPDEAIKFYTENPSWGIAFELGKSGLVSLDIDCQKSFDLILEEFGFSPEELDKYPTIKGASKGKRIMFKVPKDSNLPYVKLNWPREDDQKKKYTVFELRAADGKHRLDMAPPSIHPTTGKPYEWLVKPPKDLADWPEPPAWLLAVWENWDSLGEQFKSVCPWLPEESKPKHTKPSKPRDYNNESRADEVVNGFNDANPLRMMLDTYGYKQRGKRYLSPHSTTGLPGVHMLSEDKCWIHHASDPISSDSSGQPVSSYDLFVEYEHRGDRSAAFKDAAKILGINLKQQIAKYTPPVTTEVPSVPNDHDHMDIDFDPFIFLSNEETDKNAPLLVSESSMPVDARFADTKTPLPWASEKGAPYDHHENVQEICRRLGVTVRYNVIKKEEEIIIPRKGFSMDNGANAALAWLKSQCSVFNMPKGNISEYLTLIADSNPYNPVAEWVRSKEWDGVSRLQDLFDTVTTVEGSEELKNTLIKRWMISAIAGAFSPTGVSAHGVLVFQGEQNLGKTSWIKSLVPEDMNVFKDGVLLRPDNPDSVVQACSYWLCELGELDATFKKSDIAALKAFITSDKDIVRLPYARKSSTFARRTVFFGSVNPKEFLSDPTGNRRYWTVECKNLNYKHGLDMQQVWAEVHALWKGGEKHFLTNDEVALLNNHNEGYMVTDSIDDRFDSELNWKAKKERWEWLTTTQICQRIGIEHPRPSETSKASSLITKRKMEKKGIGGNRKVILCPPQMTAFEKN